MIYENLTSLPFQEILFILKIIFLVLFLFSIFGLIYILLKSTWLRRMGLADLVEILTFKPYGMRKTAKVWAEILKRLEKDSESEAKLAIIEADSMLGDTLKRMGYRGESLGERLKQLSRDVISNLDSLWGAHKIRNNIVHDPGYRLDLDQARSVLKIYEQTLHELEVF
ncbi:hypothetical protein KJA15_00530 [Patescibacteria group bacterium]|nr:hypothetical protein [Patescibacteria group bacterium]